MPPSFNGTASTENFAQLRTDEFYNDPLLAQLVCQALANNRELKILNEEVQIASNEVLRRRGAYLPFFNLGLGAGLNRPGLFTAEGSLEEQLNIADRPFPNPLGNYRGVFNIGWQIDIWRQLRNARDAAIERYYAAIEKRNYFLTRMVAEIADNYYELMALDQRLVILDRIIALQQKTLDGSRELVAAGRGSLLAVQRFQAEVRKNQSERLIVLQDIVFAENRINTLAYRYPQPVERRSAVFFDLTINALNVGVPPQLLLNRPDVRQAERELAAAGLDVKVARANFFPALTLTSFVGYEAFKLKYLFNPESFVANVAGELVTPLINKTAIQADYLDANAMQLQKVYDYQRVILNAFTEVVNNLAKVGNYSRSIEIKRQQLQSLETAVVTASDLFSLPRPELKGAAQTVDYLDLLTTQRDLLDATSVLIDTKRQQLGAIVKLYQALGGGTSTLCPPPDQIMSPPALQRVPEVEQLPPKPELEQLPPPRPVKGGAAGPKLPEPPPMPEPRKDMDSGVPTRLPEPRVPGPALLPALHNNTDAAVPLRLPEPRAPELPTLPGLRKQMNAP